MANLVKLNHFMDKAEQIVKGTLTLDDPLRN